MLGRPLLRRIAERVVGPGKAASIWTRIDIIGDIAVIKIPRNGDVTLEDMKALAREIMRELPYIRSVWAVASPTKEPYRVRELVHLAGEERSETVYVEHGCRFRVDVRRVFVTPRLNYEHRRIASLIRPGEVVVNMFAGAGLFSIIAACKSRPARVYSIDINPHAYRYMQVNAVENRVADVVVPLLGDAADIVKRRLRGVADRVLMPLPELALRYLYYAIEALKEHGFIHVYLHARAPSKREAIELAEKSVLMEASRHPSADARVVYSRRVRMVGPRTVQVVVDLEVWKDPG